MRKYYFLTFCLFTLFVSCKKDHLSSDKSLLSFTLTHSDNPFLPANIKGILKNDTVTFTLLNDSVSKNLIPTISISAGATINPANKQVENFTQPVVYHVQAADGSTSAYVVICNTKPGPPATAQLKNLKINGADCAYDSVSSTFYYPVASGVTLSSYTVSYDTTSAASLSFGTLKIASGATVSMALTTNKQLKLQAVNKANKVINYSLVITGVPIVELKTGGQAIGDATVNGAFNLINPDYVAENSQLEISSNIQIAVRGGTSRAYPKNSFLMDLVDVAANDTDISLLGLRNDNSWILDAMYIDQARMRNRVCTDVWNSIDNVPYLSLQPTALNGTRGYMSEVFINNRYWGVYCLTEKVDRKQLQLKKSTGNMYKSSDWGPQTEFTAVVPFDNNSETWGTWQLEYPDIGDSPAPNWGYLYNLVNFVSSASDNDFMTQIAGKVDINNMVNYFILINMFGASDNSSKNNYISCYDPVNYPAFFYSAWDLDGTLGRFPDGSYVPAGTPLIGWGNNYLLQRLVSMSSFRALVKARWTTLKANQLSKQTINLTIAHYKQILQTTQAFPREEQRWNNINQDLNTEAAYMEQWYSTEYEMMNTVMDQYFSN